MAIPNQTLALITAGAVVQTAVITIPKSDAIDLTVDLTIDITGWDIRAELFNTVNDVAVSVKLGSSGVTGGADTQILITDAALGLFTVFIATGATSVFNRSAKFEILMEDPDGKKYQVYKNQFNFTDNNITWASVS